MYMVQNEKTTQNYSSIAGGTLDKNYITDNVFNTTIHSESTKLRKYNVFTIPEVHGSLYCSPGFHKGIWF